MVDPSLIALVAIPGIALGLRVGAAALERRQRRRRWATVAERLGLEFDGREIHGVRGEQNVTARVVRRGGARTLVVAGMIDPPLDLGLRVRRRDSDLSPGGLPIGSAELLEHFSLEGDEPARLTRLLTPPLQVLLLQNRWWSCELNDYGFFMQTVDLDGTSMFLPAALEMGARVAAAVTEVRSGVPPSSVLAGYVTGWSAFARSQGLGMMSTPLCVHGFIDDVETLAYARRTRRMQFCLEVKLRFPEPLGMGLLLQSASLKDRLSVLFGADDHRLGDEVFDRTFIVRASDPEQVEQLLDEDLRRELVTYNTQLGPLSLDDDGLMVRLQRVPREPGQMLDVVGRLSALAERVGSSRHRRRRGPYR